MTSNPLEISALVVAHNEQDCLARCLDSLQFADEIVVVLDRCSDHSEQIATRYTNNLYHGAWEIEGERRNFGRLKCKGKWVLEIDADEVVPPELAEEIRVEIKKDLPGYYSIPVDNYIGKKLIRYGWGCYWGVSAAPRLTRKNDKKWGLQRIHPSIELKGPVRHLRVGFKHYVDQDLSDILKRLDRYTKQRAADLISNPDLDDGLFHNIRRLFSRFLKCYIGRKGYCEGGWGFIIALMAGLYPLLSHLRAKVEKEDSQC
ncbi:MAG: glycosyltransferase family 2 protein [Pseudomonadota bacterium]